ncbi:hypothetical protein O3P69_000944 [Scylla paramamosain]|uniref:Uncharacterized protein n=1 Tax=Scylla paramamosain TaxID=85552 RepID=A0AAW0UXN3_SCYPA
MRDKLPITGSRQHPVRRQVNKRSRNRPAQVLLMPPAPRQATTTTTTSPAVTRGSCAGVIFEGPGTCAWVTTPPRASSSRHEVLM